MVVCSSMVEYDPVCDPLWSCMFEYDRVWSNTDVYDLVRSTMDVYGLL